MFFLDDRETWCLSNTSRKGIFKKIISLDPSNTTKFKGPWPLTPSSPTMTGSSLWFFLSFSICKMRWLNYSGFFMSFISEWANREPRTFWTGSLLGLWEPRCQSVSSGLNTTFRASGGLLAFVHRHLPCPFLPFPTSSHCPPSLVRPSPLSFLTSYNLSSCFAYIKE